MAKQLASYDPSNGELLGEVEITAIAQIGEIVEKAHAASKEWRKLTFAERVAVLDKAYAQLEPHMNEMAVLLSKEMGKD
jgi:acyl-CoA reductase-like NAD-dependent aldehyde dehydrogenase